jgi:hypothetical protein
MAIFPDYNRDHIDLTNVGQLDWDYIDGERFDASTKTIGCLLPREGAAHARCADWRRSVRHLRLNELSLFSLAPMISTNDDRRGIVVAAGGWSFHRSLTRHCWPPSGAPSASIIVLCIRMISPILISS